MPVIYKGYFVIIVMAGDACDLYGHFVMIVMAAMHTEQKSPQNWL